MKPSDTVIERFLSTLPPARASEMRDILAIEGLQEKLPKQPWERMLKLVSMLGFTQSFPVSERAWEIRRKRDKRTRQLKRD